MILEIENYSKTINKRIILILHLEVVMFMDSMEETVQGKQCYFVH